MADLPVSKTQVDSAVDQARHLPESIGIMIHNAHNLQGQKDLLIWIRRVENALQQNDLQDLIDEKIPRPSEDSPKYALWRKYSKLVKGWLFTTLSDHIVKELQYTHKTYEYADEFYMAILNAAVGHNWVFSRSFDAIKRENYRTIAEFVDDYCEKWELLEKINFRTRTPADAICEVLEQVRDDMPILYLRYTVDGNSEATPSDFMSICGRVKKLAPDRQKNSALSKKNIKSTTQTSWLDLQGPSEKRARIRNEPPQAVSAEEWVKDWVESPSQKTERGKCAFCNFLGHGAADCYYLNISNRPNGWKPRPTLWCYLP